MHVRFMNLAMKTKRSRRPYMQAFKKTLESGMFIMGEEVERFEKNICEYVSSKYSLGVGSGTDALILALMAYDIKRDDEVIIPDVSFIATANAVSQVGAKVVFCDIEDDFNIDAKKLKELITPKTKAIIPVHYAGKSANMNEIMKIAKEHHIKVIEDASQAFGAMYEGKALGTIAEIGCFSLNPMKPLGALGEAGVITTSSKKIYDKLKALRYNGLNEKKECIYKSFNAKIDTLQAAFLNIKLQELDKTITKREKVFDYYNKHLSGYVITPTCENNAKNAFFTYTILVKDNLRDKLFEHLTKKEVEVKINHLSMHKEKAYKKESHTKLKNSLRLSKMKLALPCHEKLKRSELKYIVKSVKEFFNEV